MDRGRKMTNSCHQCIQIEKLQEKDMATLMSRLLSYLHCYFFKYNMLESLRTEELPTSKYLEYSFKSYGL